MGTLSLCEQKVNATRLDTDPARLEFDEAEAVHDADVNETAIILEEVLDVSTSDVGRKAAYVAAARHGLNDVMDVQSEETRFKV